MTPRRASSSATARGSWSTLSDRRRASSATSVSSASRPASRSASGSKRGSRRASPRASCKATAAVSRAPAPSWVSASRRDAAPRAIASPCWAAVRRPRISSASPGSEVSARRSRPPRARAGPGGGRPPVDPARPRRARPGSRASVPRHRPSSRGARRGHRTRRAGRAASARRASRPWSFWPWTSTSGADLVGQPGGRDRGVVEARRGPAARRDLADGDQRLGHAIEQRLDPRGLGAVTHQARVGAGAHRQPERVDQQALAGPRLAGDDVETGVEGQAQPVDEREVGDRQLQEPARGRRVVAHDGSSSTLWRSRSQNESAPRGCEEADRSFQGAHLDHVPDGDRQVLAAVDGDQRLVRVDDAAADDLFRADDDRAEGRQVGGDRGDDEVPADRVEDRTAGRERVAGRARRAGDDQAVGDEGREVGVVDRDVEPAHPGQRSAGDDDVVERHVLVGVPCPPPAARRIRPSMTMRSSKVNSPAAIRSSTVSRSLASAFDRKPTLPRLMPRIGTSTSATARAARRNVPSPPSTIERVGRRQLAQEPFRVAGRALPLPDPAHLAPTRRPRGKLRGRLLGRVVGEPDARDGHGAVTSAISSPISAHAGPGARCTRNSRLPCWPEDRRGDDRARAEPVVRRQRRRPARGPRGGSPGRARRRGPSGPCPPRTAA